MQTKIRLQLTFSKKKKQWWQQVRSNYLPLKYVFIKTFFSYSDHTYGNLGIKYSLAAEGRDQGRYGMPKLPSQK